MLARSLSALLATSAAKAATSAIIIERMPAYPLGVLPACRSSPSLDFCPVCTHHAPLGPDQLPGDRVVAQFEPKALAWLLSEVRQLEDTRELDAKFTAQELAGACLSIDEANGAQNFHPNRLGVADRDCRGFALGANVVKDNHPSSFGCLQALNELLHPVRFAFFSDNEAIDNRGTIEAFSRNGEGDWVRPQR